MRDALLDDPDEVAVNEDEQENWDYKYQATSDIAFDHSSYRKRVRSGESHSERRVPRLCLDDALIMVTDIHSSDK